MEKYEIFSNDSKKLTLAFFFFWVWSVKIYTHKIIFYWFLFQMLLSVAAEHCGKRKNWNNRMNKLNKQRFLLLFWFERRKKLYIQFIYFLRLIEKYLKVNWIEFIFLLTFSQFLNWMRINLNEHLNNEIFFFESNKKNSSFQKFFFFFLVVFQEKEPNKRFLPFWESANPITSGRTKEEKKENRIIFFFIAIYWQKKFYFFLLDFWIIH